MLALLRVRLQCRGQERESRQLRLPCDRQGAQRVGWLQRYGFGQQDAAEQAVPHCGVASLEMGHALANRFVADAGVCGHLRGATCRKRYAMLYH